MKVICAWCENEGRETLINEIDLFDMEVTSHGICIDHEKILLKQVHDLNPISRLRKPRRARTQPRSSSSPSIPNCATPWRRRRLRMPSAQLTLPFTDSAPFLLAKGPTLQLVTSGTPSGAT
jgi:hypothetical protein